MGVNIRQKCPWFQNSHRNKTKSIQFYDKFSSFTLTLFRISKPKKSWVANLALLEFEEAKIRIHLVDFHFSFAFLQC